MKTITHLIFIFSPLYFFSQNLNFKILKTDVSNNNVKVKILVSNNSNKVFQYNKEIEITDIKNSNIKDNVNLIAFYEGDKWINIPGIYYDKSRVRKTDVLKIFPHSENIITINLKKNLSEEKYRGFKLNMNVLNFNILNYIVNLYFKDLENNSYEKYELSNKLNMSKLK